MIDVRRRLCSLVAAAVVLAGCAHGAAVPTASTALGDIGEIGEGLTGPAGLRAAVYATGLTNVSAFAFDADGRLWVSTAAYEDSGTDAIYVIDRAAAAPRKIVEGVHTPLGLLWHDGSLFVASKERVDAFSGYDGTAFAQQREVVALPVGVGEVNGIALGPDGRMRVGVSAPCDSCTPTLALSGAVVSFLPDGTDVRVDASGIRAPIGLVYHPENGDLFVTMNQRDDLGADTPGDWLAVVRSGQSWGFPSCYGQPDAVCADVPRPVAELDTHAAVSGVAIVTGQLGGAVGTAAIVAEWSTGKIVLVDLSNDGSGYAGTVKPFISGLQNPVPVVVSPDGAVLIGDWSTGIVYRVTSV